MTSQLDDEGLHPMVSTLLGGGSIPKPPIKSYSREKMMELKTSKASMTRPENLSEDYNGDDGKFSPFKWLEHRWEVEGIKNRPLSKKIDSLCAGADENTGFSPQRRAFSSGCKAPADDKARDGDYDRLGGHGKNWRNGSNGGSDKFAPRGNDFKTAFQKGGQLDRGGSRGTDWKKDATRGAKFGQRREDRLGSVSGSEKLPEWADGPTTMDDMIELRGFDEPKKSKNKKNPKEKKETSKASDQPECAGSRPSSTGLSKASEPLEDPAIAFSEKKKGALPETDHELAALLGCLDVQKSSRKIGGKDEAWSDNNEEAAGGSSRLSRFFAKKSKSPELEAILASAAPTNDENVANPMLAKLFSNNVGESKTTPPNHSDLKGGMRLEDLEKGMDSKEPAKVSPFQDPSQQAQLMHHLQKVAKQQAEAHQQQNQRQATPPNGAPHHLPQHLQQTMPQGMPIVADVHLLASFSQNPMLLNAYVENQLQEAINAASRANNGQQIPAQLHEQLRMASHRNKAFLQAQTLAFVNMRNQQQHHQNLQQLAAQHQHLHKGRTPAMIPASVQRQLQKSSSNADQKKEKSSHSPTESAQESSEGQQAEMANHMKKLHMQQNYAHMVQAMNSGLGWRGNGAADPQQQQQLAANVQMLMAQHQAAQAAQMHSYKVLMNRQHQQFMIAKAMQAQQQMANIQERHAMGPQSQQQPQSSVPSELSQVGPIQTPLEKLLASVGVQGSQFTGSGDRIPQSARPMSLEDLEKQLTAAQQK